MGRQAARLLRLSPSPIYRQFATVPTAFTVGFQINQAQSKSPCPGLFCAKMTFVYMEISVSEEIVAIVEETVLLGAP